TAINLILSVGLLNRDGIILQLTIVGAPKRPDRKYILPSAPPVGVICIIPGPVGPITAERLIPNRSSVPSILMIGIGLRPRNPSIRSSSSKPSTFILSLIGAG